MQDTVLLLRIFLLFLKFLYFFLLSQGLKNQLSNHRAAVQKADGFFSIEAALPCTDFMAFVDSEPFAAA